MSMSSNDFVEGVELIERGIGKFRSGPLDYYLKSLLKARELVLDRFAPFKVGDRVTLSAEFKISPNSTGWNSCRLFLVPGSVGIVREADVTPDGMRFDVEFENESWIDDKGMVQPVSQKYVFMFREHELKKL